MPSSPVGAYIPGDVVAGITYLPQVAYKGDPWSCNSLYARTADTNKPVGSPLKVEIYRNGSLFGAEFELDVTNGDGEYNFASPQTVSDGDYFVCKVTAVGSTSPGGDIDWKVVP